MENTWKMVSGIRCNLLAINRLVVIDDKLDKLGVVGSNPTSPTQKTAFLSTQSHFCRNSVKVAFP